MGYPGGKRGAGVYQAIINQIPPHSVYIEAFLGGGAIMTLKRPAALNIGLDRESGCIATFSDPRDSPVLTMDTGAARRIERGWPPSPGTALLQRGDRARDRTSLNVAIPPIAGIAGPGVPGPPDLARAAGIVGSGGGRTSPDLASAADIVSSGGGLDPLATSGGGGPSSGPAILPAESPNPALRDPNCESGEASSFWFVEADAIEFLRAFPFKGGEVVYCDPPYVRSTRGPRDIYTYEMTDADHSRLLSVLLAIPSRVLLSGYWSKLYADALPEWRAVTFQTVNRAGRPVTEWLWCNFPEPAALHDYRYLGRNFRERERIKRKKNRWAAKLAGMPALERYALMSSLEEFAAANQSTTAGRNSP